MQFSVHLFKLVGIGMSLSSCVGKILAVSDAPLFESDTVPVLYHHCFGCHSDEQAKPKGKLRLDLAEALQSSDMIIPGRPDESELMRRVSLPHDAPDVMPPFKGGSQPSSDVERVFLRKWIADGANLGGVEGGFGIELPGERPKYG